MIGDIALSKYPHEVRLALRWAARFLASIDPPGPLQESHQRFVRALAGGRAKLEDRISHEDLSIPEGAALRILIDFARSQVRDTLTALGRLRLDLRAANRASRRKAPDRARNVG